jgi:hypothetical protein
MKLKTLITLSILVFGHFSTAQADVIFYSGFEQLIKLNDTGMTYAGNYSSGNNFAECNSNIPALQDCHLGRDVTHPDNSDGYAGFSFTKLDANGDPLADQSVDYETTPWACVQDNVTGLVWEVKTMDGGLHHAEHTFTWYNTDNTTNGGNPNLPGGQPNGTDTGSPFGSNTCHGYNAADPATFCNTEAYTARVNAQGLCGQTDWRLPDINELDSIMLYRKYGPFVPGISAPMIDINYFPNTVGEDAYPLWDNWKYWSSTPGGSSYISDYIDAFGFVLSDGYSQKWESQNIHNVRLVRGGQ